MRDLTYDYRCKSCAHEFDEPERIVEREMIDYGIGRRWVTLFEDDICPACGSMHIEKTEETKDEEQDT